MVSVSEEFIQRLRGELGGERVLTDASERCAYSYDNSRNQALPDAVVHATEHEHVVKAVRLCHDYRVPITARGRATATTGASVPIQGGVCLSLERMERILKMDPNNRSLITEPGVLNSAVQQRAKEHGFFWPPDPTSSPYCSIGGNLACNAAGPRSVKYGTCRENTLGLTAVTGTGETIHTGFHTTKGTVGYDLTRLLIGSEGTLAIITSATLKLAPLPETIVTLQAIYKDLDSATASIAAIMAQPITPCALEFVDGKSIEMIRRHAGAALPSGAGALLIIEVDGTTNAIEEYKAAITRAATNPGLLSIMAASSAEETKAIWTTRRALSPALRSVAPKKINEDVVVPVANIPEFIAKVNDLGREYDINIINFGHAGNGNIHVNLLIDSEDPQQQIHADRCLDKMFDLVISLQGTISGEHGIGIEKRAFITKEVDPSTLEIMWGIKKVFDPLTILNPGKIFPSRMIDIS